MMELWRQAGEVFKDAIRAALTQYGPGVVLLYLAVIALFVLLQRNWNARLRDKDLEIDRLVQERNALQDIVLKRRLSSGLGAEGEAPPAPKQGRDNQ